MTESPTAGPACDRVLQAVTEKLAAQNPGDLRGLFLTGSWAAGSGGPHSDIDLLLLTRHPLRTSERRAVTEMLLGLSGWSGHRASYPEVAARRPIELTVLTITEPLPALPAPRLDYQFGEWARTELLAGELPAPREDPDVLVLLAAAQQAHQRLLGARLDDLLRPVPDAELRAAARALAPDLRTELAGDERNVLLTLARILVTVETGRIVSKEVAAALAAPRLSASARAVLERARAEYLGTERADPNAGWAFAEETAAELIALLSPAASRPRPDAV